MAAGETRAKNPTPKSKPVGKNSCLDSTQGSTLLLRVHLANGKTMCFELEDEVQAQQWLEYSKEANFQEQITGLTISYGGVQYSLPRPEGYGRVFMTAEHLNGIKEQKFKGGKRIIAQADDTRVAIMVHLVQRASRISLTKTGKSVYNPILEG